MNYFNDSSSLHLNTQASILVQVPANQDVMLQMKDTWNHFVITGQCWALLIGLVIGYLLRTFTKFG